MFKKFLKYDHFFLFPNLISHCSLEFCANINMNAHNSL